MTTTELRDGTTVEDPRLDLILVDNPRALEAYPISALFEAEQPPLIDQQWPIGPRLDQGREGACVGFGWTAELMAEPAKVTGAGQETARPLYYELQRRDEFPGGEYPGASPKMGGTSVEVGAQLLTEVGHYSEYRWARTEEDIARAVGYVGPVVIGVNWHEGMRNPGSDGFIRPTGQIIGGHCVLIYGIVLDANDPEPEPEPDEPTPPSPWPPFRPPWRPPFRPHPRRPRRRTMSASDGFYRIQNSWGEKWGQNGTCLLSRTDMAQLLSNRGVACLPVRTDRTTYNGPTQ